jgi:hypothetical protein
MGFVSMALAIFAPLFVTALIIVCIALLSIYQVTAADRICKKEAMRLQHELNGLMKNLTKLNHFAKTLRNKRELAEAQVLAAQASGNPEAIATALAFRKAVIIEQEALAAQQKDFLERAGSERQQSENRLFSQSASVGIQGLRVDPNHATTLAVRPEPANSLTPDYVEKISFKEFQSQTYRYTLNLFQAWPVWLQQHVLNHALLHDLSKPLLAACSATLSTQEENWRPILKKVRL